VFVAGVPVLAGGELTGARPGRGLRREERKGTRQ
jgi:N-acyl-D-amino-acid deacylase